MDPRAGAGMKSRRRRWIRIAAGLLLLAAVWLAIEAACIGPAAAPFLFSSAEAVPARRAALLLGCSPTASGRPNLFFQHRVRAAAGLYRAGRVSCILVSGDNGREGYDEPTAIRDALVSEGVPPDHVVLDYAGFRTLDSVIRAREVFGLDGFVVVSQRFHNERAVWLAREMGIDAVGYDARDVGGEEGAWVRLREVAARVMAVLDLRLLGTGPRFLGPKVPLPEP